MQKINFTLTFLLTTLSFYAKCQATYNYPSNGGWQLVFEDNFTNGPYNKEDWNYYIDGSGGVGHILDHYPNSSTEYWYRDYQSIILEKNIVYSTPSSFVTLVSKPESPVISEYAQCSATNSILQDQIPNYRAFNYSAAALSSKKSYLYGKFEIRFRITDVQGYWPAFWLWGFSCDPYNVYGEYYREIDMFEFVTNKIHTLPSHLHSNSSYTTTNSPNTLCANSLSVDHSAKWLPFGNGFIRFDYTSWNVLTFYWEPGRIEILINGVSAWVLNDNGYLLEPSGNIKFDKPMTLVINNRTHNEDNSTWYGGISDADPDPTVSTQSDLDIDYIRIWQRLDCGQDLQVNNISQWQGDHNYLGNSVYFNAPTSWVDANGNSQCLCTYPGVECPVGSGNWVMGNSQYIDAYYTDSWHATNEFQTQNQVGGTTLRLHQVPCTTYSQYRTKNPDEHPDINTLMAQWDAAGIKYNIRHAPPPNGDSTKSLLQSNNQFTVFPNPFTSSSTLQIQLAKATTAQITLVNMMGQTVQNILPPQSIDAGQHQYTINRNNLAAGIYLLEIKTDEETVHRQVVIQ